MFTTVEFQLESLPDIGQAGAKMFRGVKRAMQTWANDYLRELVTTRLSGDPVNRRTGNLARDWVVDVEGEDLADLSVTVKTQGTANAYAGVLEYGGDITPKNGSFLWIPLPANQTSKGVARISPTEAINQPHFIKWDGAGGPTFFGKSVVKQTKAQFAENFGIVPLFALRKHTHIDARMGAGSLFQERLPRLETAIALEMQDAWGDAA